MNAVKLFYFYSNIIQVHYLNNNINIITFFILI